MIAPPPPPPVPPPPVPPSSLPPLLRPDASARRAPADPWDPTRIDDALAGDAGQPLAGALSGALAGSIDTLPLVPADPAAAGVARLSAALFLTPILAGVMAIDWFLIRAETPWWGLASVLGAILWVMLAIILPGRWIASLGHAVDGDELRVVRGNIRRVDTVVPLSRVQHIDVDQGPLQRRAGLATLVVHTAGTSATLVPVAHLPHDDALALRDAIRARIAARG